jgi:hypothetical protein
VEGAGEVRGAAEAPASGDFGDGAVGELLVGEVVSAAAQPFLAEPGAEADALMREEPVELAD